MPGGSDRANVMKTLKWPTRDRNHPYCHALQKDLILSIRQPSAESFSFMGQLTAYELEKTLRAGAHVTVNATDYTAYELEKLGRAARVGSGTVTVLQGEVLSSYEQEKVARSGAKLYVDARPAR